MVSRTGCCRRRDTIAKLRTVAARYASVGLLGLVGKDGADTAPSCSLAHLCSDRKSIEGGQGLKTRLDIAKVNLGLEERDFVVQLAFVNVHVSGPWPAIAPVAPAIAAPLERVFQVER